MPDIVIHCPHCEKSFRSVLSQDFGSNTLVVIEGCRESCPRCGKIVPTPNLVSDHSSGAPRFLPFEGSATLIDIQKKPTMNEVTFAIGRNSINSVTWKLWKRKSDVYISCREVPYWKISYHESGDDQIGFTREALDQGWVEKSENNRLFFVARRSTPYVAHAVRITQIIVQSHSDFHSFSNYKKIKPAVKPVICFPNGKYFHVFEVWYTEGHPANYLETHDFQNRSIAIIRTSKNYFFSLIDGSFSDGVFTDKPIVLDSSNSKLQEGLSFEFGISARNTFQVIVNHE